MREIRALQIGHEDWSRKYSIWKEVIFTFTKYLDEAPKKAYNIVFIDKILDKDEIDILYKNVDAYCLFVSGHVMMTDEMKELFDRKRGKILHSDKLGDFLANDIKNFYSGPYGEKYNIGRLTISQNFKGSVKWDGNYALELDGYYGEELTQIAFFRNLLPLFEDMALDLWLEYDKDDSVELAMKVTQFYNGSVSDIQNTWIFNEKQLQDTIILDNEKQSGPFFVSFMAKGAGKLSIRALHDRHSRRGYGAFFPGGEIYHTSEREELFAYFNPGDMKPPLNVYFSGYKTREGFEGNYLMQGFGSPYLLIAEPRLEGGAFYMGSKEYEQLYCDIIHKYMDELGFSSDEVIFAGLSMGTYGALYYGCDISPHAIILGKPLASIGDVARNEKLSRPGGFPTSLDVLRMHSGGSGPSSVKRLNDRFWNKFAAADWSRTKFIVSYMIEDDYDGTAYETMVKNLHSEGTEIYGKGIHGRHNDDTSGIVAWFISQYKQVLLEDFDRRI